MLKWKETQAIRRQVALLLEINKGLGDKKSNLLSLLIPSLLLPVVSGAILAGVAYRYDTLKQGSDQKFEKLKLDTDLEISTRNAKLAVMRSFGQDCDWAISDIANVRVAAIRIKQCEPGKMVNGMTRAELVNRYDFYTETFFSKPTLTGSISEVISVFNSPKVTTEADKLYEIGHQLEDKRFTSGPKKGEAIVTEEDVVDINEAANDQMRKVIEAMREDVADPAPKPNTTASPNNAPHP